MKNVFKKILATVLAVACIGTVAACGDKTPEGFTRVTFSYGVDGDVIIVSFDSNKPAVEHVLSLIHI